MPDSVTDLAGLKVGAEVFLAAVLDAAPQPLWAVGPDGLIRYANRAAIAALGYDSAHELFGRHGHDTIHGRHPDVTPHPAADCPMLRPRVTGETVSSDLDWFVRRDGSMFPASYVSAPVEMPGGRGAVVVFADIEDRVRAERTRREQDAVLESQRAALRRVAMLVASGAASPEVFAAIAREVAQVLAMALVVIWRYEPDRPASVLGAWSDRPHPFQAGTSWPVEERTAAAMLPELGRPTRIEDFGEIGGAIPDAIRSIGIRSGTGAAIVVDGEFWGVIGAGVAEDEPLDDHIEDRLAEFTELVAAAISNSASRAELARLADEQAALRRVATLVARGVPPPEVFAAVAREVGLLLGVDAMHMGRYELDGTATGVAAWSPTGDRFPIGTHVDVDGESVAALVSRTGRPARMHGYEKARGAGAALGRELGLHSSVGAPIVVDQRLWGVMIASSKGDRELPGDAESRVIAFTELAATAISNTEAREEVGRLADEQAALRRVATLAARGVPSSELFEAVGEEVGKLIGADLAAMIRYESDNTVTAIASWAAVGEPIEVRGRWPLGETGLAQTVATTRRAARTQDYGNLNEGIGGLRERLGIRSSVASPILVEGRVWGALYVHSTRSEPLAADTEARLSNFTELVATAISSADARAEVQRLADEQAALRRVATLVARESPAAEVFAAVAEEVGRLLDVEGATLVRYEPDGTASAVARWGESDAARHADQHGGRECHGAGAAHRAPRAHSTTSRTPPARSRRRSASWAFARRSAARSSSGSGCGARSSSARESPSRCPPTRSRASASSTSSSPPRCRTSRRGQSSPRPARGSWPRPTMSAAASSAISTTERSSGWCIRSSR